MATEPFTVLLAKSGLTKAELSRRLGITAHQVSVWGPNAPRYAMAYLELLVKLKEVQK